MSPELVEAARAELAAHLKLCRMATAVRDAKRALEVAEHSQGVARREHQAATQRLVNAVQAEVERGPEVEKVP